MAVIAFIIIIRNDGVDTQFSELVNISMTGDVINHVLAVIVVMNIVVSSDVTGHALSIIIYLETVPFRGSNIPIAIFSIVQSLRFIDVY